MKMLTRRICRHDLLKRLIPFRTMSVDGILENNIVSDEFTSKYNKNYVKLSGLQRIILTAGSSVMSLANPFRQDMIACLGETTGRRALENLRNEMLQTDEGQRILRDKPRINSNTVDIPKLRSLPENTFGFAYVKFLDDNQVTPDTRVDVQFLDDPELAYVMTRYRECHDMYHAILDLPIDLLGEVSVKWVEALNTQMPMCYAAGIFGALTLTAEERKKYKSLYLPWALKNGRNAKPLISVYWEEKWEKDVSEFRKELNILALKI